MSMSDRQKQILRLLQENGQLRVEQLAKLVYASPSSVRRDLTKLQNMSLLRRTHGGASLLNEHNHPASLGNRMAQNVIGKRKIAKKASVLLQDEQTVMLDSSSTASFLLPYIAKKKNVTLFTNNMSTAINAINLGISTHCIGGRSVRNSAALSGEAAYRAVSELNPDILFFSSHSIDERGVITDPTSEENYIRSLMLENARQTVFLCDSEKFGRRSIYTLTTADRVDKCVFDEPFEQLKLHNLL